MNSGEYTRAGTFISNGIANGRQVWKGLDNEFYIFSDKGKNILVSDKAKIKYDDLIIKQDK